MSLACCGAGSLLAGVLLAGAAGLERVRAVHDLEQAGRQLAALEQRLRERRDRHRMLQEYTPRYRALQRAGFIGSQPPDWVESLERLRTAVALPGLRYQLSAPRAVEEGRAGLRLHTGYLDLDLAMRHEGELLRVLDRLPLYLKGLVQPESCSLGRAEQDAQAPLHARCRIRWFTLQDAGQAGAWQG